MEPYFFSGVVLPERAQLSLNFSVKFSITGIDVDVQTRVSIVLNQVAVWVTSDHDWDIYDLRNIVKNIVQGYLAMIGYLIGYAYDIEITRVVSLERNIDYVFGIDIPCIANRGTVNDLNEELLSLRDKTVGKNGVFLHRCFADLVSAMKHPDDTGFYCYRAIESLRHHCASVSNLRDASKEIQWITFREVAEINESDIRKVKVSADPQRHGEPSDIPSTTRADLFEITWSIVEAYLKKI